MKSSFSQAALVVTVFESMSALALATPSNVPVSGAQPGLQNEEQVWICPSDPTVVYTNHRDFRLGYRQIGMGRSTDGGATWTDTLMALSYQIFDWQSDPVLTATSSGRLVHCYLDFKSSSPTYDSSFMAFLLSDDCGETWSGPYTVLPDRGPWFEDKQFIASDRSGSVHDGNVYVSWTRFSEVGGPEPTRIMFSRSTDGGMTWDDTLIVGAPFTSSCYGVFYAGQFSQPLVGKDGAVYVFWQGIDIDSSSGCSWHNAVRFNKSLDGGQTWTTERVIRRIEGYSFTSSGIDIYGQPVTEADISTGPHSGNLYLQYRDTASNDPAEIIFQRSLDTGHTWSAPFRVNDDDPSGGAEQFHNWMVVNESGTLAAIWYDTRMDVTFNQLFDVFAAYSFDGGATWTSNERISSVSSNPTLLASAMKSESDKFAVKNTTSPQSPNTPMAGRIAEYIGLTINRTALVAVWTDTRDGGQDVWSATWELHLTEPRLLTENFVTLECSDTLHWATAWLEDNDLYDVEISDDFTFTTIDYATQSTNNFMPLPLGIPAGSWHWRVKSHIASSGTPVQSSSWSASRQFTIAVSCQPCACDCHGNPVCDAAICDVLDVVSAVNVAFRNGAAIPDPNAACPYETTDVDCGGFTDVIDVVKIVNVAFRNVNPATEFCDPCP